MTDIQTFMAPVVSEMAEFTNFVDDEGHPVTDDRIVNISALIAFNLIESEIRRPLIKTLHEEVYDDVGKELRLRALPVDAEESFEVRDYYKDSLIDPSYYKLLPRQGLLSFRPFDQNDIFIYGDDLDATLNTLKVKYTAGWSLASELPDKLFQALVIMTQVVYKRRDLFGVALIQRDNYSYNVASDKGSVPESVKVLIQESVFYGTCDVL